MYKVSGAEGVNEKDGKEYSALEKVLCVNLNQINTEQYKQNRGKGGYRGGGKEKGSPGETAKKEREEFTTKTTITNLKKQKTD